MRPSGPGKSPRSRRGSGKVQGGEPPNARDMVLTQFLGRLNTNHNNVVIDALVM